MKSDFHIGSLNPTKRREIKMERLQKVMAHAGVASRRKSEQMINEGRVSVNGKIVTGMGVKVSDSDAVLVDGLPITEEKPIYILFNKPREVISTVDDPKGRTTVLDFIEGVNERIYPVGRLDYDTTGVLLLTNDGELANRLMHPSYGFEKTYVAKVEGEFTKSSAQKLATGVKFNGHKSAPAKVRIMTSDKHSETSLVEIKIFEGRNHQVKEMFKAVGHPVKKLTREQYGFLTVKDLPSGKWRFLKQNEINQLYHHSQ